MTSVWNALAWVGTLGITAMVAAIIAELRDLAGWVAPRIVRRATARLPAHLRMLREQEWLAEVAAREGLRIFRLTFALGVYFGAFRIARSHRAKALKPTSAPAATPDRRPRPNSREQSDLSAHFRHLNTSTVTISIDDVADGIRRVGYLAHKPEIIARALDQWPGDGTINYPIERGGPITYTREHFQHLAWLQLTRGELADGS